jgi:hypothetical protein
MASPPAVAVGLVPSGEGIPDVEPSDGALAEAPGVGVPSAASDAGLLIGPASGSGEAVQEVTPTESAADTVRMRHSADGGLIGRRRLTPSSCHAPDRRPLSRSGDGP